MQSCQDYHSAYVRLAYAIGCSRRLHTLAFTVATLDADFLAALCLGWHPEVQAGAPTETHSHTECGANNNTNAGTESEKELQTTFQTAPQADCGISSQTRGCSALSEVGGSLHTLRMVNTGICCAGMAQLAKALGRGCLPMLTQLDLSGNLVLDEVVHNISQVISGGHLLHLHLSDCGLSPGGAIHIIDSTTISPGLCTLNLANNVLGPTIIPALTQMLLHSRVRHLNISHTAMGPSAMDHTFFAALRCNTILEHLEVCGNRIGDPGGVGLAAVLAHRLAPVGPSDHADPHRPSHRHVDPCIPCGARRDNLCAFEAGDFRWPVQFPSVQAYAAACVYQPETVAACSLFALDLSKNRLSAVSGFALCCALAGEDVARHISLVQGRFGPSATELASDPRSNPFPEWNALSPCDWLPASLSARILARVAHSGEASPAFLLQLKY